MPNGNSILSQKEIDNLLDGAFPSTLPESIIGDLETDLQLMLPSKAKEVLIKPAPVVKPNWEKLRFREKYEDGYTYMCSDCGRPMTKNLILRPSHNHTPILNCFHCHVTIPYVPRRKNG